MKIISIYLRKKIRAAFSCRYLLILIYILSPSYINAGNRIIDINDLSLQNSIVKSFRNDVRKSIIVTRGNKSPETLPELKFIKYKLKKEDSFWKILSLSSLNIDTLSTVNSLSAPDNITDSKFLFIPNMRGVIHEVSKDETIDDISGKYNIKKEYILKVNGLLKGLELVEDSAANLEKKKFLFIPSGEISNIERSLFLGVGFASPLKDGIKSSHFGRRVDPFDGRYRFHTGVDIACPPASKVYAARGGRISFAGYKGGYGLAIIVKHENNYESYYGHLKKVLKNAGTNVRRGELIGLSGNSGRSTGPHLHFEVRKKGRAFNPGILLRADPKTSL